VTTSHVIKPLTPETLPAWLALAQTHNGVWGRCYCSYFHNDTEHTVKSEYDRPTFPDHPAMTSRMASMTTSGWSSWMLWPVSSTSTSVPRVDSAASSLKPSLKAATVAA
jgi:hypothetical protein